jgi:ubiquinone biosynthesis protein UbiJ
MKLPAAWLSWVEDRVNGYIALDPEFPHRLDALDGRTLLVEIGGMNLDIHISIAQRRLRLHQTHAQAPDVTLCGTPAGLLALLRADDPMAAIQQGMVELRGDAQLAREFKKIFDSLDIDWEEMASRLIGDWPAHRLGILAQRFRQWRRRSDDSLHRSLGEYLQEETRLLPARIEIENFITEVDALREAADRLEARLERLRARRSSR